MLKKVIKIGDKDVVFRSSATVPRLYRAKFKRDIFKDLAKLESSYKGSKEEGEEFAIDDLEIALIPEWFRTDILKEELDKNGVLVENSNITETEKFALLFEFDGDVKCIRHVLYNCSASRPSIESETKEDTIEPGTETLSLTADPREDGLVKSRTGDTTTDATYNDWYKAVYVPVAKTAQAVNGGK